MGGTNLGNGGTWAGAATPESLGPVGKAGGLGKLAGNWGGGGGWAPAWNLGGGRKSLGSKFAGKMKFSKPGGALPGARVGRAGFGATAAGGCWAAGGCCAAGGAAAPGLYFWMNAWRSCGLIWDHGHPLTLIKINYFLKKIQCFSLTINCQRNQNN